MAVQEEQLEGLDVSHGYCDDCFVIQMKIIRSMEKAARAKGKKPVRRYAF